MDLGTLRNVPQSADAIPAYLAKIIPALADALDEINGLFQVTSVAPAKTNTFPIIKYADGIHWNPGAGAGYYVWDNVAWQKLLEPGDLAAYQLKSEKDAASGYAGLDSSSRLSLAEGGMPTGAILPYGGATAPTGYVICNGTSYARTGTYAALFAVIGTAFGAADSSHFNVPDLRGKFLRGWDNGAGNDPDAAARTAAATGGATGDNVGSVQADAMQGHLHTFAGNALGTHTHSQQANTWTDGATDNNDNVNGTPAHGKGGTTGAASAGTPSGTISTPVTDGSHGTPRTSSETRGKNVNVQYIIKI